MVRNAYQGFGSEYETLLSAFDKDIANQKNRVGKDRVASTLWAMQRSRKDVAEFFDKRSGKAERIKDFAVYLSTDRGLANATIWQRCMWLKDFTQASPASPRRRPVNRPPALRPRPSSSCGSVQSAIQSCGCPRCSTARPEKSTPPVESPARRSDT